MPTNPINAEEESGDEVTALVRLLHETQQRLQELAGGEVDAVLHSGGQSYLLHEAQEKLRQSETTQRGMAGMQMAILNALPAHIALLDAHGVVLSVNEAWRRFATANMLPGSDFGVGQNYLEVCARAHGDCSEEAEESARGIRRVLCGEAEEFVLEYPCHAPTEKRWFRLMVTPLQEGGLSGAVVMHVNVTERKLAEERMHRLMESNVQGIMFWNHQGGITEANDAFLNMVGYTRSDLIAGRINWRHLTPPEYAKLDERALRELDATGICPAFEKEYIRQDGSRVPILLGAAIFESSPDEGVCFVLDLTERKKFEHQFLRAQRIESIGTLASGIAHDLNNVLAPIMMSLELLRIRFPDPASKELLSILESSAHRGADMVNQVLSFGRGVEGLKLEIQVGNIIAELEKIIQETFLKDIVVRTQIPQELSTVLGDPTQLHQVLLNLCVNARDAMPNGGTLTLSAENIRFDEHFAALDGEANPDSYILVQVEDTGTGIPPEVIEKIFDPFFTTKEPGKGTGLGLATSMTIVKSHGGFIRLDSELGKGTKFGIYLPAHTGLSAAAVEAVQAVLPRGQGELILVIDDEAAVRAITRQTLETFGYRVVVACDGAEAVAIYAGRGEEFAAVISDMMMPVMDGPAAIRILLHINPHLPVIAASGHSSVADIAKVTALGVKHFLPKPYTAETLLQTLRKVLEPVT